MIGNLFEKIANSRPNYFFEIIGHSEPELLDLPPNISLLGPKNHLEINHIAKKERSNNSIQGF